MEEKEIICDASESDRATKYESNADLFGVQLEVTLKLLEAEKRKLEVWQRELSSTLSHDNSNMGIRRKKAVQQLEMNVSRIQQQYIQLEQEYKTAAMGAIKRKSNKKRSSRSQPAIGLKQTPKSRKSVGPQMLSLSQMFDHRVAGYSTKVDGHFSENEALIFQDGNLMAGSIEALIQHLVPTTSYHPDRTYVFAFLLSSRLYIRPHSLLGEVCQVCSLQQNLSEANANREHLGKFGPNIVQLLSEWAEMFPYDFRDDRMMNQLKEITQRIVSIYPELRTDVTNIKHNLMNRLAGLQKYEEELTKWGDQALEKSKSQEVPTTDITEVCGNPLEFAQQLTHIELERLRFIGPEEFVQAFSKESHSAETTYRDVKRTSNLEAYVQWFNRLSYFVATEICSHLKKKNRVKMIEYFTDVAKECINIGNFNSLMAIIAGMNMSPVARLKKTWAKVNTSKFEILEHQMDPSNNFGSYRSCLKAAMWRSDSAASDREKIVIPFFSLFVKDIYFLNEGCNSKLANGNINFEKFWQLAKHISDFISWQQVECPFQRSGDVLSYILTTTVFSESTLSLASYECEAPETSFDKERHKKLKAQVGL
ncbi:ras-GEF domain-containing family member 1B-like isoform X2 [Argopecten irradians]|uniref:ras-GEF domain-containing family member 1B-like isoform X2 n=1 Tax=Argopecten irradians TaxID=31199 RepID=UPI003712F1ED